MKEYYKIGEISDLYGIGTDSLRYYEEIGILKPKRDDNGYRMYSISDIRTLNILRDLRSIGFSMKEIKAHLAHFNLAGTLSLFEQELEHIDKKMDELKRMREQLSGRIEEIRYHMSPAAREDAVCVRFSFAASDEELGRMLENLRLYQENSQFCHRSLG